MHICNIIFISFEGSGNRISMGLKSVPLACCLADVQNCFIGVFIIRTSSAEREKHPRKLPATILLWSHIGSRQCSTHLNVSQLLGHGIQQRNEKQPCILRHRAPTSPLPKGHLLYTNGNPALHPNIFFFCETFHVFSDVMEGDLYLEKNIVLL